MFALLAPALEGYGTGLEFLVYLSVLTPVVLLAFIWWYGSRRTV